MSILWPRYLKGNVDVNQRSPLGSTALHGAVLFGRADAAKMLLEAGADANAVDGRGNRSVDLLYTPWQQTQLVAGLVGVPVKQQEVQRGRQQIAETLGEPFDNQSAGQFAMAGTTRLAGVIAFVKHFPVMGHLWFLWFLCWLVLGFSICVTVGSRLGLPHVPPRWILSDWRYAWLIPLTVVPQYLMGQGDYAFGPDTSLGILPTPVVLGYYAIFFGFGALYYDADDSAGSVGRRWWIALPLALLLVFPVGLINCFARGGIRPRAVSGVAGHLRLAPDFWVDGALPVTVLARKQSDAIHLGFFVLAVPRAYPVDYLRPILRS